MANSSDWLARVEDRNTELPAWISALSGDVQFDERLPFAASARSPGAPVSGAAQPEEYELALAKAFADGEASGRANAEAELRALRSQYRDLKLSFRALDQAAIDVLSSELAETVVDLCAKAIEGFANDGDTLKERALEAAKRLGSGSLEFSLHLNPDDAKAVGEGTLEGWTVVADSSIERGGLAIEGPSGTVRDGPEEWRRAIAEAVRG